MDAYLAIASRREVRDYADQPILWEVQRRILEAGRVAGSSRNRQPWRFVATDERRRLDALAQTVFVPGNLQGCALAIAVALPAGAKATASLDAGRATQNILLAAWSEGVGSCPNGMTDPQRTGAILELDEGLAPTILLSLGYPARPRDPSTRSAEEWLERADRLAFEEVVRRV
jgi:nitroreductase